MKKLTWITPILLSGTMFVSCKQAPESDEAVVGDAKEINENAGAATMAIDTDNSMVEWIGTKITTYHNGTINIKSGELMAENGELVGGNFVFDKQSVLSTDPKMDEESNMKLTGHLHSDDFFDVENHPEAKFEIASVKPFSNSDVNSSEEGEWEEISEYKVSDPTHVIEGNLTMRGVTKGISFPAKVTMTENGVEAISKFNFNRMEWGVAFPGMKDDAISEMVHLGISIKTK